MCIEDHCGSNSLKYTLNHKNNVLFCFSSPAPKNNVCISIGFIEDACLYRTNIHQKMKYKADKNKDGISVY